MKIPTDQLHCSLKEGHEFNANGFDFICTGRDEEYLYCEPLIYENDIPSITDDYVGKMQDKEFNRFLDNDRWKPNGITDNREEWRKKNDMIQNCTSKPERIALIHKFTELKP